MSVMKYLLKFENINPPKTIEEMKKAKEENNKRYRNKVVNEQKYGKPRFAAQKWFLGQ